MIENSFKDDKFIMKKNTLYFGAKLSVLATLFLFLGNNLLAQVHRHTDGRNCSVCEDFIKSKPQIPKSFVIGSLGDYNGTLDYDADVYVTDLNIVDELEIAKWKSVSDELHKKGKLFYATLKALTPLGKNFEYLMDDPGIQQAVCLDVNLNSIKTPWMINLGYKDTPIRLFCGNNPRFRAYLRHQVYLISQVGVDGIMVDDFTGSPMSYGLGGCFCEYCMAGFRQYLKGKYSAEELKNFGVQNIETFNYRDVVLKHADDLNSMRIARENGEIPLDDDFRFFLYESDANLFASLKEMACRLSGHYVEMGWDNVSFQPSRAIYYDFLDLYYPEIVYQIMGVDPVFSLTPSSTKEALIRLNNEKGDEKLPPEIIYLYKFSDATNKWFVPMPEPRSWSAIRIKNMTGLLKLWISFSYANGANFNYPTKGWCFGPTSRWYYPPKDEFEPVYNFIRNNRSLFDNYKAVEQIGVLYSHSSSLRPLKYVCGQLVNMSIPFGMPVAGDNWLINRLNEKDIDRYDALLIPEPLNISNDQKEIVEKWKQNKKVIEVKEGDDIAKILENRVDPLISLESNNKIWLFPRYNTEDNKAPLVCHLVNYDYDGEKNKNNPQQNIQFQINKKLLNGLRVKDISFYSMDQSPLKISFTENGEYINVTIPEVDLWGILKIEKR